MQEIPVLVSWYLLICVLGDIYMQYPLPKAWLPSLYTALIDTDKLFVSQAGLKLDTCGKVLPSKWAKLCPIFAAYLFINPLQFISSPEAYKDWCFHLLFSTSNIIWILLLTLELKASVALLTMRFSEIFHSALNCTRTYEKHQYNFFQLKTILSKRKHLHFFVWTVSLTSRSKHCD